MNDPFHSSKYSIGRAKDHIGDLERQLGEFFATEPYRRVVEYDPNTSEDVHKLKLAKPMPVALSGIAFDAVNNLRTALDQAGYAASVAFGRNGKSANFPFADDEVQLENNIKRSCRNLPKEIVEVMRAFKPYKGGNNLLWALNRLCNTNKHAVICPVAVVSGGIHYERAVFTANSVAMMMPYWDRTKNEMELFRISAGGTSHVKFNVSTFVAIRDIEFVDGQPADAVLNEFVRIVESIVMAIEAETRRLSLL